VKTHRVTSFWKDQERRPGDVNALIRIVCDQGRRLIGKGNGLSNIRSPQKKQRPKGLNKQRKGENNAGAADLNGKKRGEVTDGRNLRKGA